VEVRGRQRAQAVGPPAVGGVDAREGVRTPESSGTVAARHGREHGRRRTWATGGRGAGPWHLKVRNEAAANRIMDVDGTAANPNLLGGPGDGAGWRSSRSEMGRRWRVGRSGARNP